MKLFDSIDKRHYKLYLDPVHYTPHFNNGCLKYLEDLEEQLLLINAYNQKIGFSSKLEKAFKHVNKSGMVTVNDSTITFKSTY